jgi:hypothetical protein
MYFFVVSFTVYPYNNFLILSLLETNASEEASNDLGTSFEEV